MQAAAGAMAGLAGQKFADWTVTVADDFSYRDKTDGSIASDQGLRIVCGADARAVLRLSGTGTKGATLRVYLERSADGSGTLHWKHAEELASMPSATARIPLSADTTGRPTPDAAP